MHDVAALGTAPLHLRQEFRVRVFFVAVFACCTVHGAYESQQSTPRALRPFTVGFHRVRYAANRIELVCRMTPGMVCVDVFLRLNSSWYSVFRQVYVSDVPRAGLATISLVGDLVESRHKKRCRWETIVEYGITDEDIAFGKDNAAGTLPGFRSARGMQEPTRVHYNYDNTVTLRGFNFVA